MKGLLISALALLFSGIWLHGQESEKIEGKYLKEEWIRGTDTLKYRIMYPYRFDPSRKYPLVVFLHGAGERGDDNESQLIHGGKLFRDSLEKYPAIILLPQCPKSDYWANLTRPDQGGRNRNFVFHTDSPPRNTLGLVIQLIDQLLNEPFTDNDRLYLTGLSMGGFGVWELLWRMPDRIAAALPICGGGPVDKAAAMTGIPVWAFHGVDDSVVHPRFTLNMVKAVQRAGGRAKLSYYPGVDHNSWDYAFAEPDFLKWMFAQNLH